MSIPEPWHNGPCTLREVLKQRTYFTPVNTLFRTHIIRVVFMIVDINRYLKLVVRQVWCFG